MMTTRRTVLLGAAALLPFRARTATTQEPAHVNVPEFVSRGVMMFADTSRGRPFAKDPSVIRFRSRYLMYYSVGPGRPEQGQEGWRIGIATSTDLVSWRKIGELGIAGAHEAKGFCAPGAIVLNGKAHLFYQTYGNGRKDAICHAWSEDGVTFTRNPDNPVFAPTGDWNCGRAIDAEVTERGGELFLYFATRDPDFVVQMQGVATAPIDSNIGKAAWTQRSNEPILKPELPWERKCIEAATIWQRDGRLYMFYAGGYNNEPQQIGCAVSDDGLSWKRIFTEPFLANGKPGEWNASESGHPGFFADADGRQYLFFQGNQDNGKSWYLSKVEIGWKDGKPVVLPTGGPARPE